MRISDWSSDVCSSDLRRACRDRVEDMSHGGESDVVGDVYAEARAWFEQNWDPDLALREWWQRLADSGWGFPTWPQGTYGRGLSGDAARQVSDARRASRVAPPPGGDAPHHAEPTLGPHAPARNRAGTSNGGYEP